MLSLTLQLYTLGNKNNTDDVVGQNVVMECINFSLQLAFSNNSKTFQVFNYTWYCRVVAPEVEIYEFLDSNGFPIDEMYDGQRLGKRDEPNFISPRPGCFGLGK